MASIAKAFNNSLNEVHQAAHNQDLVEVSKRAMRERKAEQAKAVQPLVLPEPVAVPEKATK